jgi:dihydrofolate reductase
VRQVIVNTIVSLDGYTADVHGNPLALLMDGAFDRANREDIEAADVVLLGRTSFDGFSGYWPFIADAPEHADPESPQARALDSVNRAVSRAYNRVPKVVVSDRGDIAPDNPWASTTTRLGRDEASDWVRAARQGGEGSILMFASGTLRNALLVEGLIDEMHLMISPVVLGAGIPAHTCSASLDLIEARRFEGSPNVQLRYRVVR